MLWIAQARRVTSLVLVWVVATVVFLTLHLVPGDPAELLLSTGGASPDPYAVAELRERLGLDRPILVQYLEFLQRLVAGRPRHLAGGRVPRRRGDRAAPAAHAGTDRRGHACSRCLIALPAGTYAAVHAGGGFDRAASAVGGVAAGAAGLRARHAAGPGAGAMAAAGCRLAATRPSRRIPRRHLLLLLAARCRQSPRGWRRRSSA